MDLLEQVQRRAARFVTKTYLRDECCVSQDNYSTIYIGQPQEANSKAMHALQNTKQRSRNYSSDLCPAPETPSNM